MAPPFRSVPGSDDDEVELVTVVGEPATHAFGADSTAKLAGIRLLSRSLAGDMEICVSWHNRLRPLHLASSHSRLARRPRAGAPCRQDQ